MGYDKIRYLNSNRARSGSIFSGGSAMPDSTIVNLPAPIMPETTRDLPPILLGKATPEVQHQVERFCFPVAELYQSWLNRRPSPHTRRAYDQDVMNFASSFLRLDWPDQAHELLRVSVHQAQSYRDWVAGQ